VAGRRGTGRTGSRGSRHLEVTRQAAEALKAEVLRGDRLSRRRYIREFNEEFSRYQSLSSYNALLMECWKAGIVYVGDYHALPASQGFARRLLGDLAERSSKLVLAVEVVRGKHQAVLDDWLAGRITEEEFLHQVRYRQDWDYPWVGFRDLILTARDREIRVAAIDCDPRRGLRLIRKRDRTIAAKLTSIFQEDPGRRILVHIGESHLASGHLPGVVRKALHSVGLEEREVVVVQNADEIYWALVRDGVDHFEVVKVTPRRYCAFTATPLEKYEAYRQAQEAWGREEGEEERDFQPLFHGIADSLVAFLGVDKYTWCLSQEGICIELLVDGYPEVYGPDRAAEVAAILRGLPAHRIQVMERRLADRGCCYVDERNAVFVDHFHVAEAAWEAARFVHTALSGRIRAGPAGNPAPGAAQAFYEDVLRAAIGAFGSKVAHPAQDLMDKSELQASGAADGGKKRRAAPAERVRRAAAFVSAHGMFLRRHKEGIAIPARLLRGMRVKGESFRLRTRELGLALAQKMWEAYREGAVRRRDILDLYTDPLIAEESAFRRYADLARKVEAC